MGFFIQSAHAEPQAAVSQGAMGIGLYVLLFVGMYFLLIRPQMKRNKEQRQLVDSVATGHEVVFAGGLMGRVKKLDGDYAVITIGTGVDVKVQKASVISVLPEGTLNKL